MTQHNLKQLTIEASKKCRIYAFEILEGEQLRLLAGAARGGRNPYAGGGRFGHGGNQNNQ
jgi:hypothetical protein